MVPWGNVGRQSDPNVRCTLVHVGPTMGGALTLPPPQGEHPCFLPWVDEDAMYRSSPPVLKSLDGVSFCKALHICT